MNTLLSSLPSFLSVSALKKVTEHFSGEVGLNLLWAWLLPVAVAKLHDGDLYAVGWGEGP